MADDLDAGPVDAARVSRAERLHCRFLCGKTRRKRRSEIALAATVGDFSHCEHPLDEPFAISLDGVGNATDLGSVQPGSDDVHGSTPPVRPARTFHPT